VLINFEASAVDLRHRIRYPSTPIQVDQVDLRHRIRYLKNLRYRRFLPTSTISYVFTYYIVGFWTVLTTCTYDVVYDIVYDIVCHVVYAAPAGACGGRSVREVLQEGQKTARQRYQHGQLTQIASLTGRLDMPQLGSNLTTRSKTQMKMLR
jgi:hypothetical protein